MSEASDGISFRHQHIFEIARFPMMFKKVVAVSLICAGAALWIGCSSPSSPSATAPKADLSRPDISTFQPSLTDPSGTTYAGDYFPFAAGNRWDFGGQTSIDGYEVDVYPGEPADSTPASQSGSIIAFFEILPAKSVTFSSGTYSLFPIKGYTERIINGSTSTTIDTTTYFEKVNNTVYCRGAKFADGSNVQFTDRILIKQPLAAGATWESQPQINVQDMTNAMTSNLEQNLTNIKVAIDSQVIQGKAVVVGKQAVTILGKSDSAVRVDEKMVAKISMRVSGSYQGTVMDMSFCLLASYLNNFFFARDTGWVGLNNSSETTTLVNVAAQGQVMTMREFQQEIDTKTLSSLILAPVAKRSVVTNSGLMKDGVKVSGDFSGVEEVLANLSSSITKCLKASMSIAK
jgi:hypothetical protein